MTRYRLALAAGLAALALGCTQHTLGPPSPDYKLAKDKYLAMLSKDGPTDVFNDADLGSVQALLAKVPADSVDTDAAKALQTTIAKGVADAQADLAAQKKAAAEASKAGPTATVPTLADAPAPTPAPAPPADAGAAPPPLGPIEGMSEADFNSKYGACFSVNSVFSDDKGTQGQAYVVSTLCQAKFPTFASQYVLIAGGKVTSIVPQSALTGAKKITLGTPGKPPPVVQPAPTEAANPAPPPPPNPNTVDQRVGTGDAQVAAPANLNSDLDERNKLPGQQ